MRLAGRVAIVTGGGLTAGNAQLNRELVGEGE
jgi:hypothetical protein